MPVQLSYVQLGYVQLSYVQFSSVELSCVELNWVTLTSGPLPFYAARPRLAGNLFAHFDRSQDLIGLRFIGCGFILATNVREP